MYAITGEFAPYQAGAKPVDAGTGNPYLKTHGIDPREFSRFSAALAANLGSRSSLYNPSENLSISSLYYAPTARMGMPRSVEAIKMSIRGMMGTSIRTAMSFSHGHVPQIEALHPGSNGYSKQMIQGMTHFGSGFDASKAIGFSLANPITSGFINMFIFGKPTFASTRRKIQLGLYAGSLGYARAGWPGVLVGLGILGGIYQTASFAEQRIQEEGKKKSTLGQLAEFAAFGAVAGGIEAGASAGILGGTAPGKFLKRTMTPIENLYSKLANKTGLFPPGPGTGFIPGLAEELQPWVSPFRKYYQQSILESAEWFHNPTIFGKQLPIPGLDKETALKFSEAFHGESAYVLRAAAAHGGVEKIPQNIFTKALAKDVALGAAGGLLEHTLVGAAYLGIGWAINTAFRGPWRHRVAQSPAINNPYTLPGLHPGNQGYATDYIRSMTDFGSGLDLSKVIGRALSTEALMGTKPAVRTAWGEIFKAENHGEAFLKAMSSTNRFSDQYMGNKLEQGFFIPGQGFISRSQSTIYGFETSEELYKLQGIHPGDKGFNTSIVRRGTDFGSGLDLAKTILRYAGLLEEKAIKPAAETWVNTEKYEMPESIKKRIANRVKNKLHETPTCGLTDIVLSENAVSHHHPYNKFPIA